MRLERRLQRRFRDAAGIVGDGRGGDHGDHLQQKVLAETSGQKRLAIPVVDPDGYRIEAYCSRAEA